MVSFLFVVLVFCALVAVIWGKNAAQNLFSGIAITVIVVVLGVVFIAFKIGSNMNQSNPVGSSYTPSNNYAAPQSTYTPIPTPTTVKPRVGITLEPINAQNAYLLALPRGYGVYV